MLVKSKRSRVPERQTERDADRQRQNHADVNTPRHQDGHRLDETDTDRL